MFVKTKILIALLLLQTISNAQIQELREYTSIPEEQIVFNLNFNRWNYYPQEMNLKPQSMGIDIYYMYPIAGKNKIFSIALGSGFSVQNMKSNVNIIDSCGVTKFQIINDTIKYKKNKFSTVYLDVPLEFKIRTRPKVKKRNLKFVVGIKFGLLIQSYKKFEGDNIYNIGTDASIKYKVYKIKNLLPYRYGTYLRIGYGKFSLTGFLSLSYLFEQNKTQNIQPYSIGISVTVF